MDSAHNSVNNG